MKVLFITLVLPYLFFFLYPRNISTRSTVAKGSTITMSYSHPEIAIYHAIYIIYIIKTTT